MKKIFSDGKIIFEYDETEQNRKSFALTVYPDGNTVFRTPAQATQEQRNNFLSKKAAWAAGKIAFFRQYSQKRQQYESGSDVLYLGRHYQLIIKSEQPERVVFSPGKIIFYAKKDVPFALRSFMLLRARQIFSERLAECLKLFPALNRMEITLKIRKMKKRWGSCRTNGNISLNLLLVKAPKRCIDYVIIHELCHLTHKKHGKAFYALLSQKCPDYRKLKEKLETTVFGA